MWNQTRDLPVGSDATQSLELMDDYLENKNYIKNRNFIYQNIASDLRNFEQTKTFQIEQDPSKDMNQ